MTGEFTRFGRLPRKRKAPLVKSERLLVFFRIKPAIADGVVVLFNDGPGHGGCAGELRPLGAGVRLLAFAKCNRNVSLPIRTGLFVALRNLLLAMSKKVLPFVLYGDDGDEVPLVRPNVDDDKRLRELRSFGLPPPLISASFVEFVRRKSGVAVCQLPSSEHCRLRALVNRHIRTLPSLDAVKTR